MADELTAALDAVNRASAFNRWAGVKVAAVAPGRVTLAILSRADLLNHAAALHAGVQSALLDTACGYAAGAVAGNVVTLQLNVQFLASAKGERFECRAEVLRTGKQQVFAEAHLFAIREEEEVLIANAAAVLARLGQQP